MLVLGGRSGRPRGGARQPSASRPPPCRKMPAQDEDLKTDQSSAKPQKSISEFLDLLRSRHDLPLAQTKDRGLTSASTRHIRDPARPRAQRADHSGADGSKQLASNRNPEQRTT
jgi:hypothetical protein